MTVNMGPQHPSTHGVLRLVLELDGEVVERADPHIGLLHRGTEKLIEYRPYIQSVGYFDRLDYVSPLSQEHAYVLAIEDLLGIEIPERAQYIRVLYSEITRILNHILNCTTMALDIGAMTPMLWGFEEREKLMEFYERVSGARMHANYFRPGGVHRDLPAGLLEDIAAWTETFPKVLDDIERLLNDNRIWRQRTVDIGVMTVEEALDYGFTGPMLRASGMPWDLRKSQPYEVYDRMDFDIPVGKHGDCFDRFWVLLHEVYESARIIEQAIEGMPSGPILGKVPRVIQPPEGEVYIRTENSLGELGYYLISDGDKRPYRMKIRTPSYSNVSALPYVLKGTFVSDMIAILGSFFFVLGDIDR